jgi:NAD(P)H-hydrate repair Nnr-like enzyme with NAD(P)H-hydrate epimerase domain
VVDALLGTAPVRHLPPNDPLVQLLQWLHLCPAPVLCADLPSGLQADTGQYLPGMAFERAPRSPRHTELSDAETRPLHRRRPGCGGRGLVG